MGWTTRNLLGLGSKFNRGDRLRIGATFENGKFYFFIILLLFDDIIYYTILYYNWYIKRVLMCNMSIVKVNSEAIYINEYTLYIILNYIIIAI